MFCQPLENDITYAVQYVLFTCGNHLHERTIPLRREVGANKTSLSLSPPRVIVCRYQARKLSGQVYMCYVKSTGTGYIFCLDI